MHDICTRYNLEDGIGASVDSTRASVDGIGTEVDDTGASVDSTGAGVDGIGAEVDDTGASSRDLYKDRN